MAEPVVVTIPHRLTKEEAVRRLKKGFGDVRSAVGEKFVVLTDDWAGDHLDFRASLLGQTTTGTVDVGEHSVRLEIQLPWMLALLANKAKTIVQKQGQRMLEKPGNKPTRST
jgi:hypothetical protein